MEIGRRGLLVGAANLSLAKLSSTLGGTSPTEEGPGPADQAWHPLTSSLLDRASRAGHRTDRLLVEHTIHAVAERRRRRRPLMIKWLETPTCAFEHLSRYGRAELVRMRSASFWHGPMPSAGIGEDDPERWFDLYQRATDLLRVDEHDLALMAPKLTAKRRATEVQHPRQAIFRIRAVAAHIGWLETSLPATAAESICAIEDLLSIGHAESSQAIYHQLRVFEAYENGLLATWETPEELVCVPVSAVG
jgi:hypothetical protein